MSARSRSGPPGTAATVGAVAVGGVLGAEARYLLGVAFPAAHGDWPWTTFWINVTGCLLIGLLYTTLGELRKPHWSLRPLLGVGVLGGYTTFSTWAVDTVQLTDAGRWGAALAHALVTPVVAILACAAGVIVARLLGGRPVRGGTA
ncbi:fluoride efflux transporter CrcB [Pseudonocardia phyllosphaerae]|uniref:fluoride efflux transporter CrcB n=1 Tax=Pseudonocardia phyllosphaerae TaxID=3390502 RepID=UPI00397C66B6